jgi:hypothetical protein
MYTKDFLLALRRRALRRRLWYKTLDNLGRGIYNLTCAIVDRVKSPVLLRKILSIVKTLRDALKGEFTRLMESIGVERAWKASENASNWGNIDAWKWRDETSFARFHATLEINSPTGWGP